MATAPPQGPTRTRRRSHGEDEEPEDHSGTERWMVSYADMITLLLVLFVVLFAMSQIDQSKFEQLKEGLMSSFGQSVLGGTVPVHDTQGGQSASPVNTSVQALTPAEQAHVDKAIAQTNRLASERTYGEAKSEVENLVGLWKRIHKALAAKGLGDDVQASIDQRGLVVSLVSRHVVFPANLADLTPRGTQIVDTLAPILKTIPEPIEVDGHTNQAKGKPKYYPTDWDLSVARAVTVLRRLEEFNHLPGNRLEATGFGHTKPLMAPSEAGSQDINKRVDVVVLSTASAEAKTVFNQVIENLNLRNDAAQGGLR